MKRRLLMLYNKVIERVIAVLAKQLFTAYTMKNRQVGAPLLSLYAWLYRIVQFMRTGLSFQVYQLTGQAAGGTEQLKVVYFSEGAGMAFLASMLFENDEYQKDYLEKVRFWRLAKSAYQYAHSADMVIIERNELLRWTPLKEVEVLPRPCCA